MRKGNRPKNLDRRIVIVDFFMTSLLIINLLWLSFDWFFANRTVNRFVEEITPEFHAFYAQNIHQDIAKIDIFFVIIFLAEFIIRWINSVRRGDYRAWYFYPVIHWYDVLGLIPMGYFRVLRFFRIFSIMYRLQRMGIINLKKTIIWENVILVKNMIAEEVTDRVVVNLVNGLQKEIVAGNPTQQNIAHKIVAPHRDDLVFWVKSKIKTSAQQHYVPNREAIRKKVMDNVAQVMENNESVDALERIPVVGKAVSRQLEIIIGESIFDTLDSIIETFALDDHNTAVEDITGSLLDSALERGNTDVRLQGIIQEITLAALEEVKMNAKRKNWKEQVQTDPVLDLS